MATVRWSYSKAKRSAERITDMRRTRIGRLGIRAHLGSDGAAHMAHNAKVSLDRGHPWAGVDYSLVRHILYLSSHQFDAYRILDRYVTKRDREDRMWIRPGQGDSA